MKKYIVFYVVAVIHSISSLYAMECENPFNWTGHISRVPDVDPIWVNAHKDLIDEDWNPISIYESLKTLTLPSCQITGLEEEMNTKADALYRWSKSNKEDPSLNGLSKLTLKYLNFMRKLFPHISIDKYNISEVEYQINHIAGNYCSLPKQTLYLLKEFSTQVDTEKMYERVSCLRSTSLKEVGVFANSKTLSDLSFLLSHPMITASIKSKNLTHFDQSDMTAAVCYVPTAQFRIAGINTSFITGDVCDCVVIYVNNDTHHALAHYYRQWKQTEDFNHFLEALEASDILANAAVRLTTGHYSTQLLHIYNTLRGKGFKDIQVKVLHKTFLSQPQLSDDVRKAIAFNIDPRFQPSYIFCTKGEIKILNKSDVPDILAHMKAPEILDEDNCDSFYNYDETELLNTSKVIDPLPCPWSKTEVLLRSLRDLSDNKVHND